MRLHNLLLLACGIAAMSMTACKTDDVNVKYAELPKEVKTFVANHFDGETVKTVTADIDHPTTDYDIVLLNGTKIEINANGDWEEISNKNASLPLTMLPDSVREYVVTNYASQKVVKIEKDSKGYEVKLDNGLEVEFDNAGNFVKVDK